MRSRMLLALPVTLAGWLLTVASPASAFKTYGPVWRGDAITYYNSHRPYDRFVDRGARSWNVSGMNTRFRRVSSASKADIRIGLFSGPRRRDCRAASSATRGSRCSTGASSSARG